MYTWIFRLTYFNILKCVKGCISNKLEHICTTSRKTTPTPLLLYYQMKAPHPHSWCFWRMLLYQLLKISWELCSLSQQKNVFKSKSGVLMFLKEIRSFNLFTGELTKWRRRPGPAKAQTNAIQFHESWEARAWLSYEPRPAHEINLL
jgi:hypothetical protein